MDKSEITHIFDQLGLKCYATPEAIDQKYRRLMLKVHPDKCITDESLKRAQELNALRERAKEIARDPAHHAQRQEERAKDLGPSFERVQLLERMLPILQDHLDKAMHENDPHNYSYSPIRLELASCDWTPQQRKDAEDAVRHGLERHHLDDALAEADTLLTENARLRANQSMPRAHFNQELHAAEARLAYAIQRADDLMARADQGMQATAALQEANARAAAAEADLAKANKAIERAKDDAATWKKMLDDATTELDHLRQTYLYVVGLNGSSAEQVKKLQAEVDRLKQGGSHPHTLVLPRINVDLEAELEIKTQLLAEVEENYKRSVAEVEEAYKKAYAEAEETHKQQLAEAEQKATTDRAQYSATLADLETRLAAANAWEQRLLARTAEPDALRAQLQHANEALQRESARVLQLEQQLKDVQQSDAAKSKKRKSRPASD